MEIDKPIPVRNVKKLVNELNKHELFEVEEISHTKKVKGRNTVIIEYIVKIQYPPGHHTLLRKIFETNWIAQILMDIEEKEYYVTLQDSPDNYIRLFWTWDRMKEFFQIVEKYYNRAFVLNIS